MFGRDFERLIDEATRTGKTYRLDFIDTTTYAVWEEGVQAIQIWYPQSSRPARIIHWLPNVSLRGHTWTLEEVKEGVPQRTPYRIGRVWLLVEE